MGGEYDQPLYVQGQGRRPRLEYEKKIEAKLPNFERFSCHSAQIPTTVNVLKFRTLSLSVVK